MADCEQYEKKGGFGSILKGMVIGGAIGAGIALLSSPRSGPENREMLREKGSELRERARVSTEEVRLRAEEIARKGRERANELVDRGQVIYSEQKNRVESVVQGIKEGARTYQELNEPTNGDYPGSTG